MTVIAAVAARDGDGPTRNPATSGGGEVCLSRSVERSSSLFLPFALFSSRSFPPTLALPCVNEAGIVRLKKMWSSTILACSLVKASGNSYRLLLFFVRQHPN